MGDSFAWFPDKSNGPPAGQPLYYIQGGLSVRIRRSPPFFYKRCPACPEPMQSIDFKGIKNGQKWTIFVRFVRVEESM